MLAVREAREEPVEQLERARIVPRLGRELARQEQRGRHARIGRRRLAREPRPQLARHLQPPPAIFRPAQREGDVRAERVAREVGEEAAVERRGRLVLPQPVRGFAIHHEGGSAQRRRERHLQERLGLGAGLGELARLEIHLGEPEPGVSGERRQRRELADGLEALARLGGLPRAASRLPAQHEHIGAHVRLEAPGQELLEEGLRLLRPLLLGGPACQDKGDRQGEAPRPIRGLELAGLGARPCEVGEIEQGLHEARAHPQLLRHPWIGGEEPAVGLHGLQRLAGGAPPPAQSEEPHLDQELRAGGGEHLEPRHGSSGIPQPAKRLAEPERHLGGERRGQAPIEEGRPLVAGLGMAPERIEGQRPAVARPGDDLRRHAALEQALEGGQGAGGLSALEHHPRERVGREQSQGIPRVVLGDERQVDLDGLPACQPEARLGQPVARLAERGPVGPLLHRARQLRLGLLELAPLVARLAALEQLRGQPEDAAERVAREQPRWTERGRGPEGGIRDDPRKRQLREGARPFGQRQPGHRHGRLLDRRRHGPQERRKIRRRQRQRLGRARARCEEGDQRERRGHGATRRPRPAAHGLAALPPARALAGLLAAGLSLGASAARRAFAHRWSSLSGLPAATWS